MDGFPCWCLLSSNQSCFAAEPEPCSLFHSTLLLNELKINIVFFLQPFCNVTSLLPTPASNQCRQKPEVIRYRESKHLSPAPRLLGQGASQHPNRHQKIPGRAPKGCSSNMGPSYKLKSPKLQKLSEQDNS